MEYLKVRGICVMREDLNHPDDSTQEIITRLCSPPHLCSVF